MIRTITFFIVEVIPTLQDGVRIRRAIRIGRSRINFRKRGIVAPSESLCIEQNKQTISTVNSLIETLKDGQEGFKQAAEGVADPQRVTNVTRLQCKI